MLQSRNHFHFALAAPQCIWQKTYRPPLGYFNQKPNMLQLKGCYSWRSSVCAPWVRPVNSWKEDIYFHKCPKFSFCSANYVCPLMYIICSLLRSHQDTHGLLIHQNLPTYTLFKCEFCYVSDMLQQRWNKNPRTVTKQVHLKPSRIPIHKFLVYL